MRLGLDRRGGSGLGFISILWSQSDLDGAFFEVWVK
jgi:hypothetical protein